MRRISSVTETREQCLRKALQYEWQSENSRSEVAAAWAWDQARLWRSMTLVAEPEAIQMPGPRARAR